MCRTSITLTLGLSLLTLSFPAELVRAQRAPADLSTMLLDGARCVPAASSQYDSLDTNKYATSINRQVQDVQFSLQAISGQYITLSCRADSQRYATLSLRMGVADNLVERAANLTINIYQGGNVVNTYRNVRPGTMVTNILDLQRRDIANASNIAIEMACQSRSTLVVDSCWLGFVEARLLPSGRSTPLNRQSPSPLTESTESPSSPSTVASPLPSPTSTRQDATPGRQGGGNNLFQRLVDGLIDRLGL